VQDFSNKNRKLIIDQIQNQEFDLIIIGGGITGAGIFLDAQSRGLHCCLIEMQDFAEGTSSRSTRLIHGGLRYLKQWNFSLVMKTGRERNIINHIARHLTYPKQVVVPVIKGGSFSKLQLTFALYIYEMLAKVLTKYRHISRSTNQIIKELPFIKKQGLQGAVEYTEYQTNDARLTLENIKKGVEFGGVAINRLKVLEITKLDGQVNGVAVEDTITHQKYSVQSKAVVCAIGAWTDSLISKNKNSKINKIAPSKGIHLVFEKSKFPVNKVIYFDTHDGRMMFAIPEDTTTYVGTTDTFYKDDIAQLEINKNDVEYILQACNNMFPDLKLIKQDIKSGWVGVRPLIYEEGKKPSEISRKEEVFVDVYGMIAIAGGKLTGYRKMAQKVVRLVMKKHFGGIQFKKCATKTITLTGSDFVNEIDFETKKQQFIDEAIQTGWSKKNALWVFKHFGSESQKIVNTQVSVATNLPEYLAKCLQYSLDYEMVLDASDFFIRRTNLLYFYPEVVRDNYMFVSDFIVEYLEQTEEQKVKGLNKIEKALSQVEALAV
jgi:glycerol-3-phosphate dehydrogenase